MKDNVFSQFKTWLTPDGLNFFIELYDRYGTVMVVLPGPIPHAVHFHEGMQVRNWMRQNTDYEEDDIENGWAEFVEIFIQIEKNGRK